MRIGFAVSPATRPLAERLAASLDHPPVIAENVAALGDRLPGISGLVVSTGLYDAQAVALLRQKARKLRWVQSLSSGVDHHLEAGLPEGVVLTSASGAHAPGVADHALALALCLLRGLPAFHAAAAQQRWLNGSEAPRMGSLQGANCLVLGHGAIGAAVVQRLMGFGARLTVANRRPPFLPPGVDHRGLDAFDDVLPQTDLVFVCLPETPETKGILSRARLVALPSHGLIINIGRGSLIDEPALVEALALGRLGGAGLDVTAIEPLPSGHPLWQLPNVVITPHLAGRSDQIYDRLGDIVQENISRFLSGRDLLNVRAVGPVPGA